MMDFIGFGIKDSGNPVDFDLMKNYIFLFIIVLLLTSCKSSNGHCDAYGNKSSQGINNDNFDIYSSTNESMSKYVTTIRIK